MDKSLLCIIMLSIISTSMVFGNSYNWVRPPTDYTLNGSLWDFTGSYIIPTVDVPAVVDNDVVIGDIGTTSVNITRITPPILGFEIPFFEFSALSGASTIGGMDNAIVVRGNKNDVANTNPGFFLCNDSMNSCIGASFDEKNNVMSFAKVGAGASNPQFSFLGKGWFPSAQIGSLEVADNTTSKTLAVSDNLGFNLKLMNNSFPNDAPFYINDSSRFIGDINQTDGNATFNMLGAEMYIHEDNATEIAFTAQDTYVNVTTGFDKGLINGFIYSTGKLTAYEGGVYSCDISVSISGQTGSTHGFTCGVNGLKQDKCYSRRKLQSIDTGNLGVTCLLDLTAGDVITLMAADEDVTLNNITIRAGNLNLRRWWN